MVVVRHIVRQEKTRWKTELKAHQREAEEQRVRNLGWPSHSLTAVAANSARNDTSTLEMTRWCFFVARWHWFTVAASFDSFCLRSSLDPRCPEKQDLGLKWGTMARRWQVSSVVVVCRSGLYRELESWLSFSHRRWKNIRSSFKVNAVKR